MRENVVVILHIQRDIVILLLFFDHQDTESEYCGIDIVKSWLVSIQENIKGNMGKIYLYNLQYWRKIWWRLFVSVDIDPLFY